MDESQRHQLEYRPRRKRDEIPRWEYVLAGVIWLAIAAVLAGITLLFVFAPNDAKTWDM